ncbi:MAG TPA: DPP IV N-terminal domain-containing protein [Flavobacteriales bacterium]|nr:DPP IV N-terminal domain-containing protein [Flavobacteriales bacterium]
MKKTGILAFLVVQAGILSAQKNLTIQEAIVGARSTLAPAKLRQLGFTMNPGQVSYADVVAGREQLVLWSVNPKAKLIPPIALDDINTAIKGEKKLKSIPFIEWTGSTTFRFVHDKQYWEYDMSSSSLVPAKSGVVTAGLENADVSPNGKTAAFTRDHNLYIKMNDSIKAVSTDGNYNVVYGEAAHRNEFGINKGTFWSPKGTYLAFYRMDQTMVTDYPIINWDVKPALNENVKYPMAGDKSHQVTLGIYNMANGSTTYVKTEGDPEQYLTNIAWSADESKIYIAIVNRAQNNMKLNEYEATTGKFVKTLFEENDSKYIEPLLPLMVIKNNPEQFIWQSNRDGYKHIYLYDFTGKMLKQITKGNWEIKSINGFDPKGENLFFHCNMSSPVNQDFCMVNLKTGKIKTITTGDGFHTCTLDANCTYALDNYSNITIPRITRVIDLKTGKFTEMQKAENPAKDYALGKLRLFTIKNKENTDLYCRMYYPTAFDSTKKYPVVVYLYNGPHSQMVTNSWLGGAPDLWYHYMAEKGFIVFTLDGRGTDNRGKAFSQAIHRQVGTAEMEDQMSGVDFLKSKSYVDASRMGIHGWSYGGFMTTSIMTRYPGVFKAAVAGGPVIDWSYYEIMYTERYMDTPQENKAGFDGNNLLNRIQDLKGKLLVIHGAQDDVVVWQHSLMLLKKSVEKGVQLDYYVYPGHQHNVLGKDRAHLMEKVSNYFIDNL